jgi:hypothetical protein
MFNGGFLKNVRHSNADDSPLMSPGQFTNLNGSQFDRGERDSIAGSVSTVKQGTHRINTSNASAFNQSGEHFNILA